MKKAVGTLILLVCVLLMSDARPQAAAPQNVPGMVYVAAGEFHMGSDMNQRDEKPLHKVVLDGFYIDVTEVTVGAYTQCVRAGKCRSSRRGKAVGKGFPQMTASHPAIGVTWNDADNYCRWAGKRLPTEAEWEKAARGTTGAPFPWGDTIDCNRANYASCAIGHPVPVGSYPSGKSPYGALDMAGNVQEWVADWYDPGYYAKSPEANPKGPEQGIRKVLRGGSYDYVWSSVRTSYRFNDLPTNWDNGYGFRCAK